MTLIYESIILEVLGCSALHNTSLKYNSTEKELNTEVEMCCVPSVINAPMDSRGYLLYDKGEALHIAGAQFPIQTRTIVRKIVELIKSNHSI